MNPWQDLTSEELLRKVSEEILTLHQAEVGMRLEIAPEVAFAVVAMLQLALRHPQATEGASAALVKGFIELVKGKFAAHCPAISEAIRRGDDPVYDDEVAR